MTLVRRGPSRRTRQRPGQPLRVPFDSNRKRGIPDETNVAARLTEDASTRGKVIRRSRSHPGVCSCGHRTSDAPSNLSGGASIINLCAAEAAGRASDPEPRVRQGEELLSGPGIVPEDPAERRSDRTRILLLHAAHHHAEVDGLDDDADAAGPAPRRCASAICSVRRSCTWSRRAKTSTRRGSFDRPTIAPFGMYATCAFRRTAACDARTASRSRCRARAPCSCAPPRTRLRPRRPRRHS